MLDLFGHELVVDNFAGGGGASEGIEQALGRSVDLAINHDETAITVHTANHPGAEHSVADVWDINPEQATRGMPVGLAWFSPDCRHHSKAKGGKPVSKRVRGLAWVAARWAARIKPRAIILENVEEFLDWGPLIKDAEGKCRPDPARRGQTFQGFVRNLQRHGYQVDWRTLRACDYGTPTIRRRLFLIARRDGLPIKWPKPTHADPASPAAQRGKMLPWPSAASCIDWSLPCPSIFERSRPLADATLRRIAKGVMRYVVESDNPFVAQAPAAGGQKRALVSAFIAKHYTGVTGADARAPMPTITATDHNAPVAVSLVNLKGSERGGRCASEPVPTICAGGTHVAAVAAFLIKYYGQGIGQTCGEPLHTMPTRDRFGLVTVAIQGEQYAIADIGMRMLQPHELAMAQGFPDGYQFAEAEGSAVPKYQQVRLIGNSVCPPLARAIVEANFSHEEKMLTTKPAEAA